MITCKQTVLWIYTLLCIYLPWIHIMKGELKYENN